MNETLHIADTMMTLLWTMIRVSGVVMMAPLLGAVFIPARVRIIVVGVLSVAMLPAIGDIPQISPLSVEGFLVVIRELAFGLAIGFLLKLAVEAAVLAGQVISNGMGLSFATVVDPQRGGMPLLGRLYIIIATLLLMANNVHLTLISMVADSFRLIPIGTGNISTGTARFIADFGSAIFSGGLQLALPSIVAILMVNVSFGVISRAAPTLNLFAVGFPISMLVGFFVITISFKNHGPVWEGLFSNALSSISRVIGGG